MKFPGVIIAILLSAHSASSQETRVPINYDTAHLSKVATAIRTTDKITIDGKMEEPAWQLAVPVTDLIESRPVAGAPARERTEVRFLYDEENLYAAVYCYDSDPKRITLNSIQEDYPFNESDNATIMIDSLHDLRTGFSFNFNPGGAKRDSQVFNDGASSSNDWDGLWDLRTTITDEGWFAELIIPFRTLRFSKSPTQEWGLNISRRVLRMNEDANWAPIPIRYSNFKISLAGTLTGLENIHQGRNLKVKPFVSAGVTRGITHSNDADGGVDLKYSLTPSLTLDATYRTDFAQVEVDQQQVNLTRFNLFFPEKRDFFLENTGIFAIGAFGFAANSANVIPFFSRRIGLSAAGTPIPIIGGARVSGQLKGYDLGFLSMKTERLGATPSNNFVVGRLKRNVLRNSWVGTLVTNRDSTISRDYNRLYGTDAHFQFYNKLEFDSFLMKTDTPGRTGRNQTRRFETGWKDDEWSLTAEYNEVQPNFNPEVGFVRRRDIEQYSSDAAWKPLIRRSAAIRNLTFQSAYDYYGGSGSGKVETRTSESTIGVVFENNASINFVVNDTFDRLAAPLRIPSGNPHVAIPSGDYKFLAYTGNFTTNIRRKISGNGAYNWGDFYGGQIKHFTSGLNLKPNYHLTLNLTYDRNRVTLPTGSFTTDLVGTKLIYGFTPRAFFNAYIQYNADTHLVSSNLRFNWTHHPLSDLYLVYNDTRDTLSHRPRERAFIVKLTNLFNF